LKFTTPRGNRCLRIPDFYITSKFKALIDDLLQTGKVNTNLYNLLKDDEKQILDHIITISKVDIQLPENDSSNTEFLTGRQLQERLPVLLGSLVAGNDSDVLKNQISDLLQALKSRKLMTATGVQAINKKVFGGNI